MKAAIDSVSLIFILKVPELRKLVISYFEKIYVTEFVYREVFESKVSEEIVQIDKTKLFFKRKNPKKILQTKLGRGELETISLALEEKLMFISEDQKAVLFATSIGIKTASILSILIKAREDGKIGKKNVRDILFKLVENGLYISSDVFSVVLGRLEMD